MSINNYPKVLVVANNCFSLTNSNGRTLGNFFIGWPKDKLAQFCISAHNPNFDLCNNYYCISDKAALNSLLKMRSVGGIRLSVNNFDSENKQIIEPKMRMLKTPFKTILRNLIWSSGLWKSNEYNKWIEEFNPDLILLLSGDSVFMLNIAIDIAQMLNKPLCLFNAEGYYFFNQNYMYSGVFDELFFPIYSYFYKNAFKKMMKHVKFCIYANDMLKKDYDHFFDVESTVMYTGSSIKFQKKKRISNNPIFSYLGTLGLGRHKALIEIGEVLQSINKNYYLDVYGNALTLRMKEDLSNAKGIRFKGFVDYENVKRILYESDVLFHAESQEKQWQERLKYGFSTKIADSICSGISFVLYSSPNIACADYIKKTGAGWFCSDKESLKSCIKKILTDDNARNTKLERAKKIAMKNHDISCNAEIMRNLLNSKIIGVS